MTQRKSFNALAPTEDYEIEISGNVFKLNPSLPGYVVLDYVTNGSSGDVALAAKATKSIFNNAIVTEDLPRWEEFANDPKNNATLKFLNEVAEYILDVLAGNSQGQSGTG